MTAPAIVMMVVTILLVWGGLVASVVALRGVDTSHSDEEHAASDEPATHGA